MQSAPQSENEWLQKLVGRWTMEAECVMGPDQEPMKSNGTEIVRSLGGLWTIGEGQGTPPGSDQLVHSIMTLGFDPAKKQYVGSFVASCMAQIWIYTGSIDATGRILTLDTDGPAFSGDGLAKYQDIIEHLSDDHRTLSSQVLGEDGQWVRFMTAHYRSV